MTIPIYSEKALSSGHSQASLSSKTTSSVLKTEALTETKKNHENSQKPESSIQISHEAKFLNHYINSTPEEEIDWVKINAIKADLNAGTYSLDYKEIAEKIIDFEKKIV